MGELISLSEARQRKALKGTGRLEKAFNPSDKELSARIASIHASIKRINKLMEEVRREDKEKV